MNRQIPFSVPDIGMEEENAVLWVLRSGWLSRGPKCREFEEEFASYTGAKHAISLSSCTAALHLSLLAYGIGPGDEVITTPLTFPATINAILYVGATPVFVDVWDNYNMNPDLVLAAITDRTKAVIGVDMHGTPCEIPYLPDNIVYIEDAAHSLGADVVCYSKDTLGSGLITNGVRKKVGSVADTTCFSFYATKNITTGDGGMLTTNDDYIAEKVRSLSLHGMNTNAWKRYLREEQDNPSPYEASRRLWDIEGLGYKYNMTDIQAAIGIAQLRKLDENLEHRRLLASYYSESIRSCISESRIILPPKRHCNHLYAVRIENRDLVARKLSDRGIGVGVHFYPIHSTKWYSDKLDLGFDLCPKAWDIGMTTLSLPFHNKLHPDIIDYVVKNLREVLCEI